MSARRQSGLSLVELMVWMAVSLIILTVITAVYANAKQVTRVNDTLARLQENGRFVLYLFDRDLRMASFRGCSGTGAAPVNVLGSTAYPYKFDVGVAGFHASGTGWSPALDASVSGLNPAPTAGSDIVTVRLIDGTGLPLTARMSSATDNLQVSAGSAIAAGDLVLVADCLASAIFEVTAVSSTGLISHDVVATPAPGNTAASLGHIFGNDATVYRLVTRTYYVAPSARRTGTTSLWAASTPAYDGTVQPVELVEGVDKIALLFGEDTDNDRAANKYVAADAVGTWANVVSAKPQVLIATTQDRMTTSPQPYTFNGTTTTPTDNRLRSVISSVITLRNRVP